MAQQQTYCMFPLSMLNTAVCVFIAKIAKNL